MFSRMMAQPVPKRMKGIRLPRRVSVRSEMPPKMGSRNRASTLSAAMMAPEKVSFRWKVLVRIRGTMLSYICQKAQMDRKARPTRMVRLLFSFIYETSAKFVYLFYSIQTNFTIRKLTATFLRW